jgi:hypothetical protein
MSAWQMHPEENETIDDAEKKERARRRRAAIALRKRVGPPGRGPSSFDF